MAMQQETNEREDWLVAVYLTSRRQGTDSLAVIIDQPEIEVRQMVAEGGKIECERSSGYGGRSK